MKSPHKINGAMTFTFNHARYKAGVIVSEASRSNLMLCNLFTFVLNVCAFPLPQIRDYTQKFEKKRKIQHKEILEEIPIFF